MNLLLQFLRTTGVGMPKSPTKEQRELNRKKWQDEKDKKEKRHRHHRKDYDDHYNHDDWTY